VLQPRQNIYRYLNLMQPPRPRSHSRNNIRELPAGLSNLSELRSLSLSSNPLGPAPTAAPAGLPSRYGRGAIGAATTGAARYGGSSAGGATAGGTGLTEEAARLPALASLACADCGLEALPEELGDCRGQPLFSQLVASGNSLARLPAGLARASALVKLELQVSPAAPWCCFGGLISPGAIHDSRGRGRLCGCRYRTR
jgi:Leucine-rich repeat (LRR) protein